MSNKFSNGRALRVSLTGVLANSMICNLSRNYIIIIIIIIIRKIIQGAESSQPSYKTMEMKPFSVKTISISPHQSASELKPQV